MTPDAAGIEAALAAGLAAAVAQALHNVPGVECDHIDGMQPTCESDAAHVAAALLPVVTQAQAEAWDEGYVSGHSNAMRRMSDEPNAPTTPNPYRARADESGA